MAARNYGGVLKGTLALIVLSAASWALWLGFDAWPSVVGTWKADSEPTELFTFTRDGKFIVSSRAGSGDLPVGTYVQDGGYIKIETDDEISLKGNGHLAFTLKIKFEGTDKFTTDGPIGTYIWQRKVITFNRLSETEAAKLRKELAEQPQRQRMRLRD